MTGRRAGLTVVLFALAGMTVASHAKSFYQHPKQPTRQTRADEAGDRADTAPEPEPDASGSVTPTRDRAHCPESRRAAGRDLLSYRGRVVDANGRPVQGARLRVTGALPFADPSWCASLFADGVTDRQGRFDISGLPFEGPFTAYTLSAESDELFAHRRLPADGDHHLRVRVRRTRAVRIEVECTTPPQSRTVRGVLFPTSPSVTAFGLPVHQMQRREALRAVSGGRFETQLRLRPGAYRLQFEGPCGGDARTIRVPRRGPVTPVVLSLPHAEAGDVELLFENESIRDVHLYSEGNYLRGLHAGADARLLLERLAPGRYRFAANFGRRIRPACVHEVDVRPGVVTQVRLVYEGCYVTPPEVCRPVEP